MGADPIRVQPHPTAHVVVCAPARVPPARLPAPVRVIGATRRAVVMVDMRGSHEEARGGLHGRVDGSLCALCQGGHGRGARGGGVEGGEGGAQLLRRGCRVLQQLEQRVLFDGRNLFGV